MHRLALHDWPFNVRELVSAVEHAAEQARGGELAAGHLPESVGTRSRAPEPEPIAATSMPRRKRPSAGELRELLSREGGNIAAVARALGRDPAQVYRWLRQHSIRPEEFR